MKPCLLCSTQCADDAATCPSCGEGSFGAAVADDVKTADHAEPDHEPHGKPKRHGKAR